MAGCPPVTSQPQTVSNTFNTDSGEVGSPEFGVPSQLAPLSNVKQVHIQQVLHVLEACTGWEIQNQYNIANDFGTHLYFAQEESSVAARCCCGNIRPFQMKISNSTTNEVAIQIERPLNCQGYCFPCCLQEISIESPPGVAIGYVKEVQSCCIPRYDIFDANHEKIFSTTGICCYCKCCTDVNFTVYDQHDQAAMIVKHWNGCAECYAGVSNYSINFETEMNAKKKAILLGTAFLIEYMYFEYKQS